MIRNGLLPTSNRYRPRSPPLFIPLVSRRFGRSRIVVNLGVVTSPDYSGDLLADARDFFSSSLEVFFMLKYRIPLC